MMTKWVAFRRRLWTWLSYRPMSDEDLSMIAFYELMSNPSITTYTWEYNYLQEKWIEIRKETLSWNAFTRTMKGFTDSFAKVGEAAQSAAATMADAMGRSASQIRRGWNEQ